MHHIAVLELEVALAASELDLRQLEDLVLRVLGGQFDRVARAVGGAARDRLPLVRGVVGVAGADGDLARVDVEHLGGDLGEHRVGALADVLAARHEHKGAVLVHADDRGRGHVGGLRRRFPAARDALGTDEVGRDLLAGLVVLEFLDNRLEAVLIAAVLEDLAGRSGAARPQSVDPADVDLRHADLVRDHIEVLLDGEVDLTHAEAPVRAADRMVGVDAVAVAPDVVDVVGAGAGDARRLDDVDAVLGVSAASQTYSIFWARILPSDLRTPVLRVA